MMITAHNIHRFSVYMGLVLHLSNTVLVVFFLPEIIITPLIHNYEDLKVFFQADFITLKIPSSYHNLLRKTGNLEP